MFADVDKLILKCIRRGKGARIVTVIFKKNQKVGRFTQPDFKTHYNSQDSVVLAKEQINILTEQKAKPRNRLT